MPAVTMKLRTSDGGSAADAGYQVPGLLAIVQPPAVKVCPRLLMTFSSQVVPAGMPLTRTAS